MWRLMTTGPINSIGQYISTLVYPLAKARRKGKCKSNQIMTVTDSGSRHAGIKRWVYLLCIAGYCLVATIAKSQDTLVRADSCPEKDLPDVIREWRKKPPKEKKDKSGS